MENTRDRPKQRSLVPRAKCMKSIYKSSQSFRGWCVHFYFLLFDVSSACSETDTPDTRSLARHSDLSKRWIFKLRDIFPSANGNKSLVPPSVTVTPRRVKKELAPATVPTPSLVTVQMKFPSVFQRRETERLFCIDCRPLRYISVFTSRRDWPDKS